MFTRITSPFASASNNESTRASQPGPIYNAATVSHGTNQLVVAVQALVLVGLAVFVVRRRPSLPGAVAAAAAAPVLFLLLNKVFSAQYILVIVAAGFLAAALVGRSRPIGVLLLIAATANALVYPLTVQWRPASAVLFACALVSVGLILGGIDRPTLDRARRGVKRRSGLRRDDRAVGVEARTRCAEVLP